MVQPGIARGGGQLGSIEHVIDLERQALLIFASIAILASICVRRLDCRAPACACESEHAAALGIGHDVRNDLRTVNVVRVDDRGAGVRGCQWSASSRCRRFGPLGLARQLEFDTGVSLDAAVLARR